MISAEALSHYKPVLALNPLVMALAASSELFDILPG